MRSFGIDRRAARPVKFSGAGGFCVFVASRRRASKESLYEHEWRRGGQEDGRGPNPCAADHRGIDVNDYDPLRDYLKTQTVPEFVLTFERIEEILDAALPRAAHRASWWETLRSPQEKMPQREACIAGGYIATRLADGKSVRFTKIKAGR
jgi:hypothetical protein